MSTECSILNISALQPLAQSVSICTDFTIHKLPSLLYTSQVYFFKHGSKRFCPLQLKGVNKQKKVTHYLNTNPQSVKCLTHSVELELSLRGAKHLPETKDSNTAEYSVDGDIFYNQWLLYGSALQDLCIGLLVLFLPVGYAMLMRLNKAETTVHGCQCLVGVWMCHLLQLVERSYLCSQMCANPHKKNRMTHPLRGSWKLIDPPLTKGSKTDDPPPLCSGPPPPPHTFWPVPKETNY